MCVCVCVCGRHKKSTTYSSLQTCFLVAHSSGDFNGRIMQYHRLYTILIADVTVTVDRKTHAPWTETASNNLSSTKLLLRIKTTARQTHTSDSLQATSRPATTTTPHRSNAQNTATLPNSVKTSGHLKTTTSTIPSPGAFYPLTCLTTAQANDANDALKRNS